MTDQKRRSPAADGTVEAVGQALESLLRHLVASNVPAFLGVDVTMSQAKVLHVALLHPDISMSALAAELQVSASAISGLVDRLVEHGYVDRREDPTDRRQQLVNLTPTGRDTVDRLREFGAGHVRPLLAHLTSSELRALHAGITALDRAASTARPSAADPTHHERASA